MTRSITLSSRVTLFLLGLALILSTVKVVGCIPTLAAIPLSAAAIAAGVVLILTAFSR